MKHRILATITLAWLLAACGGGGGAGGGAPSPLGPGAFHSVGFKGFHGPPDKARTSVGTLLSDGVSTLTDLGSTVNDDEGTISVDAGGAVVTYSVLPDGVLSISDGLGEQLRGGLGAGGTTAALAAVFPAPASEARLVLAVKKGAGLSEATLGGAFHTCTFGKDGGKHVGIVGTAVFDGIGGVGLVTAFTNFDGVIAGPGFSAGSYTVAGDGTFSLNATYSGGATATGDFAIAGGGVVPGSLNLTWVFLRQATTAEIGTLTGTYTIVGAGYDLANGKYYDAVGSVRIEGGGHCTVTVTINREGSLDTLVNSSTYTVASDGKLILTFGGTGASLQGAISADGSLGMLGGGITAGADPALFVLFRR